MYLPFGPVSYFSAHMTDISYVVGLVASHRATCCLFMTFLLLHAFRNLWFGVYALGSCAHFGVGYLLYVVSCALSFTGYSLPRSNVSYHAIVVIVSLVGSLLPFYSQGFIRLVFGAQMPEGSHNQMMRLELLHIFLAHFVLVLILFHLHILHLDLSSAGVMEETQGNSSLYGGYLLMDLVLFLWSLFILVQVIYSLRDRTGTHEMHWVKADPLKTPNHMRPEYYFLHFYAVLRSVHYKGVGIMFLGWMMTLVVYDVVSTQHTS